MQLRRVLYTNRLGSRSAHATHAIHANAKVPEYVTKAPGSKYIATFQDVVPQASRPCVP